MATLATVTDFECHDFGCGRIATQFHDSYQTAAQPNRSMLERFKAGVICNVHAGGIKRRWQSRWPSRNDETLTPLNEKILSSPEWEKAAHGYLTERKARNDAARAANEEARRKNQLEAEARFAKAWVERSLEVEPEVTRGTDRNSYNDNYRDGFTIGSRESHWDNTQVIAAQDGRNPAYIEITSMVHWSPPQARAIAKALLMAADLADIRDATNGPKGE